MSCNQLRGCISNGDSHGDEKHVGNTVLESTGNEAHDGEEYSKYFADNIFGCKSHPHSQTNQPVTADSPAFKVSEAQAFGVATFYSYLSVEKRGKYIIRMCESAPCHVAGADEVLKTLEAHLGIKVGETTSDGKFTLELTECVGQCQATPVVTINSEPIFGVKPEMVPEILAKFK